jgi:ribosomal protein S1
MGQLLGEFRPGRPLRNSMVFGEVVMTTEKYAWVNIGQKVESLVDIEEAIRFNLKVGDRREFYILGEPDEDGYAMLSVAWESVLIAQKTNATIEARIKDVAKEKGSDHIPGLKAEINGLPAFIPSSKLEVRGPAVRRLIGTVVPVKVLTTNLDSRKIVLSQKDAAEELRAARFAALAHGQTVNGTVTNVTDFGVFAAIGDGVSGLIRKQEISNNRSITKDQLQKLFPIGKELELFVTDVDTEKQKVSFRPTEQPQVKLLSELQAGMMLSGRVARIKSFGAFIELENSLEGLVFNSELGVPDKTAEQVLTVDQIVQVVIRTVNCETEKVSLALKQPSLD